MLFPGRSQVRAPIEGVLAAGKSVRAVGLVAPDQAVAVTNSSDPVQARQEPRVGGVELDRASPAATRPGMVPPRCWTQARHRAGVGMLITGVLIAGFQLLLDSRPTPSEQETPLMWPGGALFPGRRELRVPGRAGGGYLTGRRRALQHCAQCAGGDRLGLVNAWVPRPKSCAEPPRRRFHER